MSAKAELAADAALIASLRDDPSFHIPQEPPASVTASFAYHDGALWRRNPSSGWYVCDDIDPHSLLRAYRKDALEFLDWFAPTAARLASELEAAMADAGMINIKRKAA